jgi:maltoporin
MHRPFIVLLAVLVCSVCLLAAAPVTAQTEQDTDSDTSSGSETDSTPPVTPGRTNAVSETGGEPDQDTDSDGSSGSDFEFGSYGRARVDFEEDGSPGRIPNVVAHGPRIFEPSYAELDFRYIIRADSGLDVSVLTTVALFEPFAHFTGDFGEARLGVRNLYAKIGNFVPELDGLSIWAGSRMFRGDDVYLLDWWPLDNLNTMGGGLTYEIGDFEARLHAGVNRLDDDFQFQRIQTDRSGFGTTDQVVLDRQRTIGSLRATYVWPELIGDVGGKVVGYGEYHGIPEGRRIPPNLLEDGSPPYPTDEISVDLPAESGYVLGAQLGLFEEETANHLNLFFRTASGLAAYGEFGIPYGLNTERSADGAREYVGALSANWENEWVGVLTGAYIRRFNDADRELDDPDDFIEGAASVRPLIFITDHFHQGFEFSYQRKYPFGVDPESGQQSVPELYQLSVMEIVSMGRGSYERPQIRLRYTAAFANDDAQDRFPAGDVRRPDDVEHIISIGAEWWFNSSTY